MDRQAQRCQQALAVDVQMEARTRGAPVVLADRCMPDTALDLAFALLALHE
jgi:hypothetical protein